MKRIYIIGFTGTGKTRLAGELAGLTGRKHIDLDQWIEERTGQTISEIFATSGEAFFREAEQKALKEVMQSEDVVISTGGGTPCFFDNMDQMLKTGVCIYLKSKPDQLFSWLMHNSAHRPLIAGLSGDELMEWIRNELNLREPFYQRAQLCIDSLNIDIKKLAEDLAG